MEYGKHKGKQKIIKKSQYIFLSGHTSMAMSIQLGNILFLYCILIFSSNCILEFLSASYANHCVNLHQFEQIVLSFGERGVMSMHLLSSHFNADKLLLSHFNADKLPIISRPITFGLIPNFLFLSSFTCVLEIELMQLR